MELIWQPFPASASLTLLGPDILNTLNLNPENMVLYCPPPYRLDMHYENHTRLHFRILNTERARPII
jgi:hypothetical protein